ncbi:MAG TPA: glyoxalase superfamily protein [Steroidobacteraceae bacterium]|nr:glyoxalase superfamily protein [Steroidobacteraceae bacterium]
MSGSKLQSIAPIFQVANMQRAIDYYTRVLGFAIEWTAGEPPTHASVSRDSVEISLTVETAPVPSRVYIEVNDVDDYFGRIAAAGAFVKVPLADRPYGMRDGRVDDADGNSIQLGEPLIK